MTRANAATENTVTSKANLSPGDTLALIERIVDHRVRQLRRRRTSAEWTEEDLRQELICQAYASLPAFDPARAALPGFLTAVVHRHAKNLLRNGAARRRDPARTCSWSLRSGNGDLVDRSAYLSTSAHERRLGSRRSLEDELILRLDLEWVRTQLTAEEAQLVELCQEASLRKAAKQFGRPRTTLQHWLARLAERFEDQGLRDFL